MSEPNSKEQDSTKSGNSEFEGMLSQEHKDKIAELLLAKLGNRKCEMCDNETWSIEDALLSPLILQSNFDRKTINSDLSLTSPMIGISCMNCGNTKMFAAKRMGFALPGGPE